MNQLNSAQIIALSSEVLGTILSERTGNVLSCLSGSLHIAHNKKIACSGYPAIDIELKTSGSSRVRLQLSLDHLRSITSRHDFAWRIPFVEITDLASPEDKHAQAQQTSQSKISLYFRNIPVRKYRPKRRTRMLRASEVLGAPASNWLTTNQAIDAAIEILQLPQTRLEELINPDHRRAVPLPLA